MGSIKFMLDIIRGKPVKFPHHPNTKTLSLITAPVVIIKNSPSQSQNQFEALCLVRCGFYFSYSGNVLNESFGSENFETY